MSSWIPYAVLGMLSAGLQMALFKVPAAKNINKYSLTAWSYLFTLLIALVALHRYIIFDIQTILYSCVWGTSFTVLSLMQMHVLHKRDTSGVFPFTSLASNIFVIIGGVMFLRDSISLLQWFAILLSIFLFIGAQLGNKKHFAVEVLPSFAGIALLSTFNKFIQNAGANRFEVNNFIFWQLAFAFFSSFLMLLFVKKQITIKGLIHRHLLGWALGLGVLQFITNLAIVKSLSLGPISLILLLSGCIHFLQPCLLHYSLKKK